VLYVKRSNEKQAEAQRKAAERRAEEENKDRAFQAFMKAQSTGHDFVTGKNQEMKPEELFAGIQGDPNIYNVIFTWTYKKRNQNHPIQHALFNDNEHMNVKQTSRGFVKEDISFTYGYTSNDDPIMIATKYYPPPPDDKSNLGGEIMVIVRAVE
jgi:hypothetical protein